MGYKESRGQFEAHYQTWSNMDWWKEWAEKRPFNDLIKEYGRAKLDCLIAEMKYKEDIVGLEPNHEAYWELFDLANKAKHTSKLLDEIMLHIINW